MQSCFKFFVIICSLGFGLQLNAQNLINGDLLVCSNSNATYTLVPGAYSNISWTVQGGILNSGQGNSQISVTWDYKSNGLIAIMVKDTQSATFKYDTLRVSIDTSCVWPGDANHDHKVSYTDFLALVEGFNDHHRACMDTSTLWQGQARCNWNDTIGLKIEKKHVDCNGDGIIDFNDTNAIIRNYAKTGLKKKEDVWLCPPPQKGDPELRIYSTTDTLVPGHSLYASVYFGTPFLTAKGVFGIAFSISYDRNIFDGSSIQIDTSHQWITFNCDSPLVFFRNFPDEGHMDFVFARTNHIPIEGSGELANLKFHIKDKISLNTTSTKMTLGEFQFLSMNGPLSGVMRTNDSFVVLGNTAIENTTNTLSKIEIYPDPATDYIILKSSNNLLSVRVFDYVGKQLINQKFGGNNNQEKIMLSSLNHGIYFVEVINVFKERSFQKIIVK